MHIVLLILKIIGIILLVLLGLVLTLILLLVFVPFCYRAEGSFYDGKPYVMARVRYLFPLLQVFVRYRDAEPENSPDDSAVGAENLPVDKDLMRNLEGKVKVFGITVYDFFAEKDEKEPEEKPRKREKSVKREKAAMREESVKPDASENSKFDDSSAKLSEDRPDASAAKSIARERLDGILSEESIAIIEEELSKEKKTLSQKIREFIAALKEKLQAFLRKIAEIKEKGLQLKEKATELKEKFDYYYGIWQQDYTQRAFAKAKKQLLKLWKSIRPKKGLLKVHVGTGDPGSTGQICGFFGMIYPFVGKYVMIEPDFEQTIYEGDFYFKGRITVFAFLKVAWVVLFDKDIKRLRQILMNS